MMGRLYLFCPSCGRKTVNYREKRPITECNYRCTRCKWYAFTNTDDPEDHRKLARLRRENNPKALKQVLARIAELHLEGPPGASSGDAEQMRGGIICTG